MDSNEVNKYKKPIQVYSCQSMQKKPSPTATAPPITTPKGFVMAVKYIELVAYHAAFAHRSEVKLHELHLLEAKFGTKN